MRDVERLREKIEFSLDGRQVWALGFSALLLLAGVFTVGLLVGRRTPPPAQAPAGDLTALDSIAVREKPAAVPARPSSPVVTEAAAAEPARPPPPAEPAPQKPPEPAHAATVVSAPRPPTVVQPAPRPVQVASAAPVVLAAPPRDVGDFTVQIGSSQDRFEAQRMEKKASAAGLKPYVVAADLGQKGTWYRVRVGAFKDKDSANRFRKDVERELRASAVVMPSH